MRSNEAVINFYFGPLGLNLIVLATHPAKMSLSNNSTFNHNLKRPNEPANSEGGYKVSPFGEINKVCQKKATVYLDMNH